jgi:regulatory protein
MDMVAKRAPTEKLRSEKLGPEKPEKPGRKPGPKPVTKQRLTNIAKYHVERFATTAANLTRVLSRRAERARRVHGGEAREHAAWIAEIVERMVKTGAIDDARYALGRTTTLRRLGKSPGKIRVALAGKGVARGLVDSAIADTALTLDGNDAALEAAMSYARRRRLGPFGVEIADKDERRKQAAKDMAALARAGFSYDIAKRVMAADKDDQ